MTSAGAHVWLEELIVMRAPLNDVEVVSAIVDACLASRVEDVLLVTLPRLPNRCLAPACVPQLARLLAGGVIRRLHIVGCEGQAPWLDGAAAAVLAGALRANRTLTALILENVGLWRDAAAALVLLAALTSHPSVDFLQLTDNNVDDAARNGVGDALAALVAANAPVLRTLAVRIAA
jgi:hypothetical protein